MKSDNQKNVATSNRDFSKLIDLISRFKSGIGLIVLVIGLSFASDYFLTVHNLINVARQISINAILAFGMTFVILTSGIDLSVGSMLALSSIITASLLTGGYPIFIAILAGLLVGTLLGLANGLMVAKAKMPAFIVTLGMMAIARGLTLDYSNGRPISGFDEGFRIIGAGHIGFIPIPVIVMILILLICYIILKKTPFGRYIYAIGGNENAAKLSGINTDVVKTSAYVISGFLAGVSGVILAARLNSAQPTAGTGYELNAIAAVVLGGTSLAGGRGNIIGTIIGALIIGILHNGLNLLDVSSFYQSVAKGAVILVAVFLDRRSKRN